MRREKESLQLAIAQGLIYPLQGLLKVWPIFSSHNVTNVWLQVHSTPADSVGCHAAKSKSMMLHFRS